MGYKSVQAYGLERGFFFSFFTAKVVILSLNIKIVCLHQIKQF